MYIPLERCGGLTCTHQRLHGTKVRPERTHRHKGPPNWLTLIGNRKQKLSVPYAMELSDSRQPTQLSP